MSDLPVYLVPALVRAIGHNAEHGYIESRVFSRDNVSGTLEYEKWRQLSSLGFIRLCDEQMERAFEDGQMLSFSDYFEVLPAGRYAALSLATRFLFWGGACVASAFFGALVGRSIS